MKTIRMVRGDGKAADVHPDMVEDYRAGGFEIAEGARADFAPDGDGKPGGSLPKAKRKRKVK